MSSTISRRALIGAPPALLAGAALGVLPQAAAAASMDAATNRESAIRLAANENPYGPGPAARAAILAALGDSWKYPITEEMALKALIGEREGLTPRHVLVGDGSSEILHIAAVLCGEGELVTATPTFSFVVEHVRAVGGSVREVPLDGQLRYDLKALRAAVSPATRLVYVCNPNNPTGTLVDPARLERFLDEVPGDVLVLVDEAYHEYVTDKDYRSLLSQATVRPNLIVTRTFSKIYALASLRVGYAVTAASTIEQLRKAQAPFSVNDLGQAAAIASLDSPDELESRVSLNAEGRAWLENRLSGLGVRFMASQANFVYLRLGAPTEVVTEAFVRHGVIVRPFPAGWVRVSVGTTAENRRFAEALDAELLTLSAE